MSFRIKIIITALITVLATQCSWKKRGLQSSVAREGQREVTHIITLLNEGKREELEELISKPPESSEDTLLLQLHGAVQKCLPQNSDSNQLLSEVVAHCAEKGKDISLSAILDNEDAKNKLTSKDIGDALITAVGEDKHQVVKTILDKASDKVENDAAGGALITATQKGHTGMVDFILEKVSSKITEEDIGDALKTAAREGFANAVRAILDKASDKVGNDAAGDAFNIAIRTNHTGTASLILEKALSKITEEDIGRALNTATEKGNREVADQILEKALSKITKDDMGTALKTAARKNRNNITSAILGAALDENGALDKIERAAIDSAFDIAAEKVYSRIVKIILDSASNRVESKSIIEAFEFAVEDDSRASLVKAILGHEEVKAIIQDDVVAQALKSAADRNYANVEKAILNNWHTKKAFIAAIEKSDTDLIAVILGKWKPGQPLIEAVESGDSELVNAIINTPKALEKVKDEELESAFMQAASDNTQVTILEIIVGNSTAKDRISQATTSQAFSTAVKEDYRATVVAILANVKGKLTTEDVKKAFSQAVSTLATDFVEAIVNNAGDKLGNEDVVDVFKKAERSEREIVLMLSIDSVKDKIDSVKDKIDSTNINDVFQKAAENGSSGVVEAVMKNAQDKLNNEFIATALATSVNEPTSKAIVDNWDEAILLNALEEATVLAGLMNNSYLIMNSEHREFFLTRLRPEEIKAAFMEAAKKGWYNKAIKFILAQYSSSLDRDTLKSSLNAAVEAGKALVSDVSKQAENTMLLKGILDSLYVQSVLQKEDIEEAINIAQGNTEIVDLLTGYQNTWPANT
ncbi:MAG: ankyrin repeat domain-containing protein [Cytophagales bacterium]|nr:ankyrin repeat domain-containing protein [Cytophagales bacterium]